MMKLAGLFSCLCLAAISVRSQSTVNIAERPLVIPTYPVAPPDKNPIFYTGRIYQGARGEIYPHPMYDVLTDKKADREYKAVFIDNEYTELCVMPELGGRILSALDKTDQYDFVYRQHVIKPALIGMIGAWISGGVEWNIPDHHRATSQLPVDYILERNPDGSKTVWVGETELSRGLQWRVGLTLYPGRSYVEATVKVINPTPFIQPFLYWANLSVHCDENYQVIFPPSTRFGVQHAKNEFTSWPIGTNTYGGVNRKGTELSWWKNHPNPASIFAWNFQDDFLAGYDHKKEAGTVHIANHQVVGGKKFFLWGNNPESKMWEKMLTDSDGQYLELMTGAYSDNQPDYSWIAPGESRIFKQFWYPIKKIGGVKNATVDAAVNLERKSSNSVTVGLNATGMFKRARLIIKAGNKNILDSSIDIDPATPFIRDFAVGSDEKDTSLSVRLFSKEGQELVAYRPVQPVDEPMPKPIERPREPRTYSSNEELYLTGLRIEQFRNAAMDPLPYYLEALKRDSLDYRVNTVLGIDAAKDGRLDEAEQYLERAVKRATKDYTKPKDGESFYYLGIAQQLQKRYKAATDNLWKATWYTGYQSAAYFRLAQISSMEKKYKKALELIDLTLSSNTKSPEALSLKTFLLRKTGKNDEASRLADLTLLIDPLNHWAACEKYFVSQARAGTAFWSVENVQDFKSRCGGNVQSALELALNYGNIGANEEALQVIARFSQLKEAESDFPLLYYYQGFFQYKSGDTPAADTSFRRASRANPDYCFPFRIEEMEILKTALRLENNNGKAHYYLGNLYFFLNQQDRALTEWELSVKSDSSFYQAYRNLGFAFSQVNHDIKAAIVAYKRAIALNNQDARLFTELDVIQERGGVPANERLLLLEKNISTVEKRDDAVTRLLELYNITGNYDRSLPILTSRHFHVWEGGGNIHDTYVDACLLSGIAKMKKREYKSALEDFSLAERFPDNLEVGEPYYNYRSSEINYFIAQAYTGLRDSTLAKEYYRKILEDKNYRSINNRSGFYHALAMQNLRQGADSKLFLEKMAESSRARLKSNENPDFFSKFGSGTSAENRLSENYLILGLAYFGKGEKDLAREQFTKAITLDQNNIWAKVFLDMKTL